MCMFNIRKFKIGLLEKYIFLFSKIGLKQVWVEIFKKSSNLFFSLRLYGIFKLPDIMSILSNLIYFSP